MDASAVEAAVEQMEEPKAADALLPNPEVSLQKRLDDLRAVELTRIDRPRFDKDVPPLLEVKTSALHFRVTAMWMLLR